MYEFGSISALGFMLAGLFRLATLIFCLLSSCFKRMLILAIIYRPKLWYAEILLLYTYNTPTRS
jgi:hypothetical protein